MAWWVRTIVAVAVVLVPGAFVLFLGYVCVRALRVAWRSTGLRSGGVARLRAALASVRLRDIFQEARAVLRAYRAEGPGSVHRATYPGCR